MAERDDEKVVRRYRELGREEPAREVDERIVAAARRAAGRPHMRRWAVPLSLAAVIVLSVAVSLRVEHERIAPEESRRQQNVGPAATQQAAPAAPAAGRPSRESSDRERFERAAPAAAEERAKQLGAEASPERVLERIAALRRAGRDDEADRLLAEFRRRYPDYRIPESMRGKLER